MNNVFEANERLLNFFQLGDLTETRIENDVLGNPLFIGYSPIANANPALNIWMILKIEYDVNGNTTRKRLPTNGRALIYSWNDRATYF